MTKKKTKRSKRIDQGHWYCNTSLYVELDEEYKEEKILKVFGK